MNLHNDDVLESIIVTFASRYKDCVGCIVDKFSWRATVRKAVIRFNFEALLDRK